MGKRPEEKRIEGGILQVPASIGEEFGTTIAKLVRAIHGDVVSDVKGLGHDYKNGALFSLDGYKLRVLMQAEFLLNKYQPITDAIARRAVDRMIRRALKSSERGINASFRKMGGHLAIDTDFFKGRLKEISAAAAEESVFLIKLIPERYLHDVQTALLRSVGQGGKGVSEMIPLLNALYKGNRRKAELTSLDLTRKFYNTVQAERMKSVGITHFIWQHSGGGREPRKEHQEMSGKMYSLEDPPFIGVMYGQKVYGLPGQLPNCRCTMRPVISFENRHEDN